MSIDGDVVRGLPPNEPAGLRQIVLDVAKHRPVSAEKVAQAALSSPIVHLWERPPPQPRPIAYRGTDLILGGAAQRRVLERTLEQARKIAIIHSTFVDEKRFVDLLPCLEAAIARGVSIFVLWGKDDVPGAKRIGKAVVDRLRTSDRVRNLYPRLIIDPFSTRSHAKMILADQGVEGKYCAIVGSCNWFSSGFGSFEASMRLTDAQALCDVVAVLSDMVSANGTLWSSPVMRELAAIASELRMAPPTQGANGMAAVIVGSQHGEVIRRVRDEVKRRIVITSHRLGTYAGPGILAPLSQVVKSRSIDAQLFFTTKTGVLDRSAQDHLVEDFVRAGLKIEAVAEPRLHAKMLAWDDDYVLITSQNWLSADSGDDPSEVGILVQAPKAADRLIREFTLARSAEIKALS